MIHKGLELVRQNATMICKLIDEINITMDDKREWARQEFKPGEDYHGVDYLIQHGLLDKIEATLKKVYASGPEDAVQELLKLKKEIRNL